MSLGGNAYLSPRSEGQQKAAALTPGMPIAPSGANYGYTWSGGRGVASSPGPAVAHHEVVNVVESVAKGFQGAMDSVMEKFAELHAKGSDDAHGMTTDKFQAISGLEFKRAPPTIRDDDPDLDRHDLGFDNMLSLIHI